MFLVVGGGVLENQTKTLQAWEEYDMVQTGPEAGFKSLKPSTRTFVIWVGARETPARCRQCRLLLLAE